MRIEGRSNTTEFSVQLRDLIWAVNSHSLLAAGPDIAGAESGHVDAWHLDAAQVDPDHLTAFLAETPGYRVGRYFERLILYWLKYIRQVEIIADALQIHDGNRTIGEIDLLFRDEQQRLTHWEIAVKFYLNYPHDGGMGSHYIGPNAADTFERKIERLFVHQLRRSETHVPDVDIRQAFVKGRIFYHPSQQSSQKLPARLSPDHLRSEWIRSSELDLLSVARDVSYRILRKPFWLSKDVAHTSAGEAMSPEEMIESLTRKFTAEDRPVLISQLEVDGPELVESNRFFVVPERWPDRE